MPAPKYTGRKCIGYGGASCPRKATHPPQRCEACWRRARYANPRDPYRAQVRAKQAAYHARRRAAMQARRAAAAPTQPPKKPAASSSD